MKKMKPIPVEHRHKLKPFVHRDLATCTHVFLRDFARGSLEGPYLGPFKILNRKSDRIFEIEVNGTPRSVSVENIKPAHFVRNDLETSQNGTSHDQGLGNPTPTLRTYARKKKVTFKV